jgi:ribonuclease VapC
VTAREVVVDPSAALALLGGEPAGAWVIDVLGDSSRRLMSAASLVELGIVLEARFGPVGAAVADRFLRDAQVEVVPFDRDQAELAIAAWRGFGKGRHRAGLNLGDCFTYALAAATQSAVLCTGEDFPATDLEVVGRPI